MLLLFAISTLAIGIPDNKINENEFEQYSKTEEEIKNRFQNQKKKIKKLLQSETSLENITNLDLLNHSLINNSTNNHNYHHHQQQQNKSSINTQDNQTPINHKHHHNRMKKKLHRRKHFNHYKKPENQSISLQNKTLFNEKQINFKNNEKIKDHKIVQIKKLINEIKQQSKINESDTNDTKLETNQHDIHVDKKLSDELFQKYKKLGQKVQHLNRKRKSHQQTESNEHIPIHKWDEYQKKKLQQRLREFERAFKSFEIEKNEQIEKEKSENATQANKIDKKSQKKSINSNSKVSKVLKSNYTIGAVIFVGIIVITLVVVLISKKSNKVNDGSNADCHESNEAISNESL